MADLPLLYNGSSSDTGAITIAVGTKLVVDLVFIPNAGFTGVAIFEQGS